MRPNQYSTEITVRLAAPFDTLLHAFNVERYDSGRLRHAWRVVEARRPCQLSLPDCRGRWISVCSYCTWALSVPLLGRRTLESNCALDLTLMSLPVSFNRYSAPTHFV